MRQTDEDDMEGGEQDKHPEKRAKAAYKNFEDERLKEMRKEYPTLKISQLKEKLWKEVSSEHVDYCLVEKESSESHECLESLVRVQRISDAQVKCFT